MEVTAHLLLLVQIAAAAGITWRAVDRINHMGPRTRAAWAAAWVALAGAAAWVLLGAAQGTLRPDPRAATLLAAVAVLVWIDRRRA